MDTDRLCQTGATTVDHDGLCGCAAAAPPYSIPYTVRVVGLDATATAGITVTDYRKTQRAVRFPNKAVSLTSHGRATSRPVHCRAVSGRES